MESVGVGNSYLSAFFPLLKETGPCNRVDASNHRLITEQRTTQLCCCVVQGRNLRRECGDGSKDGGHDGRAFREEDV